MKISGLKKVFVGRPLATAQARHERLSKTSALAVFSSDALSSVAYATEEILLVLVLAGTVALGYSIPIGIAIAVLIAIVVSSYRQTILAYPQGGGAYIVAKDNLGTLSGAGRGRRAPDRLRAHRRGERRGRRGRAHVGLPGALPVPRGALRAGGGAICDGEPPRHSRVGAALRRAHLPLRRELRRHARLRLRPVDHRRRASRRARAAGMPTRLQGIDTLPDPPRLRLRVRGADRRGGGLRRRAGLQAARGPERAVTSSSGWASS